LYTDFKLVARLDVGLVLTGLLINLLIHCKFKTMTNIVPTYKLLSHRIVHYRIKHYKLSDIITVERCSIDICVAMLAAMFTI